VERPIILKAHEVRGILDDRQTQLRRIVKSAAGATSVATKGNGWFFQKEGPNAQIGVFIRENPFGQVGDQLWGRETWGQQGWPHTDRLVYRADELHQVNKWTPSVQMPRWASRVLLEIVNVRVERLQDISANDAIAEGATSVPDCYGFRNMHAGWSIEWPEGNPDYLEKSTAALDKLLRASIPLGAPGIHNGR
jgi:hypothetical protein